MQRIETTHRLELSTGDVFEGQGFGASGIATGEVVFTTAMVGYPEALTDPSYAGQILVFSYPLMGNYGAPLQETETWMNLGFESCKPQIAGIVITTASEEAFHWRSAQTLHRWLQDFSVPGLMGIDTRSLIQCIRKNPPVLGKMGAIADREALRERPFFDPAVVDWMPLVSTAKPQVFNENRLEVFNENRPQVFVPAAGKRKTRIALIDCGTKANIIRELLSRNCEVHLLPWTTKLSSYDCDAFVISNGPGDPARNKNLIEEIRLLLEMKRPILGICLGHQILGLAAGARTRRLNFGHRGHNHPVFDVETGRGFITSQNHGYVIASESLPEDWKIWFLNANDQSIEGIRHMDYPYFGVQFHPEASPGPRETNWIFDYFCEAVTHASS